MGNQMTAVLFAGVNVTDNVIKTNEGDFSYKSSAVWEFELIENLKELAKNEKVCEAHQLATKLYKEEEVRQENDDYTYRHVNFNIMRNYRNVVIEELVEIMQAWNEFIDFPSYQLGIINIAYEFDIESVDVK